MTFVYCYLKKGGDISLSIEETNKLRAKLGLKPLDAPDVKQEDGKVRFYMKSN